MVGKYDGPKDYRLCSSCIDRIFWIVTGVPEAIQEYYLCLD